MIDYTPERLVSQFNRLVAERKTVDQQWDLIRRYVTPYRGNFFRSVNNEHSVEWRENRDIFDSTAVKANINLSNSMHGALTSPSFRWFYFAFRNQKLIDSNEANVWIQECAKITYSELQDSNFNVEASETYTDLTSYGGSVIMEEVIEDKAMNFEELNFSSLPNEECYYETDHKGDLVRFFRRLKWTAEQIYQKFSDNEYTIPENIMERYNKMDNNADIIVIFCVYKEEANKDSDTSRILSKERRPYQYKYVTHNQPTILGSGGYYEMPAYVPLWRKTAGSKFGNSPAMAAMADILTLNQLTELNLAAIEKVVDPAIITTERGLLTDLDLGPAGVNVVKKMGEMEVFESRARFNDVRQEREDLRNSIREAFYTNDLTLKDSPAMTAQEVRVRYEQMQRLLGPTLGRLENSFLNPMISMTFNNLYRYGRFPEPPQIVLDNNGAMDIQYMGPLSRAQKSDQAASIQVWMAAVTEIASVLPDVLDVPDVEAVVKHLADLEGVPAKLINDKSKIKEKRDQREKAAAEAQQAETAKTAAQGAEAASKAGIL